MASQQRHRNRGKDGLLADLLKKQADRGQHGVQPDAPTRHLHDSFQDSQRSNAVKRAISCLDICMGLAGGQHLVIDASLGDVCLGR